MTALSIIQRLAVQIMAKILACLLGAFTLLLSIDSDHANSGLELLDLQICCKWLKMFNNMYDVVMAL